MHPLEERLRRGRRDFLATIGSGIGGLAVASLLLQDGALAAAPSSGSSGSSDPNPNPQSAIRNPQSQLPHLPPRAKNCIFVFLAGAPSQLDLFDPKPKLRELTGQRLPESMTREAKLAFISKTAVLMGSPRTFRKHGECGMELSDLLPHLSKHADELALIRTLHTDAFNHHPGQLMMNTGSDRFGRPSIGSWVNYGLGSASRNLPGYVVLWAGETTQGANSLWTSGFMPAPYQGVLFRSEGEPVLNLENPPGLPPAAQRRSLDALGELNRLRYDRIGDPEIESRIAQYELAFRMQQSAPELIDLRGESPATLDAYGVTRQDKVQRAFATNCLLARRLVERGVRFVNLYMGGWDQHSNLDAGLAKNCRVVDQPVATLLTDLKQRGLLDSTLVVWGAEFGRTPLAQGQPGSEKVGRDHHPLAYSVWMAGGGVKGGTVVGETDEFGWFPVKDPVHINDFHATLLHLFGIDHERLTYLFQGRKFRLTDVGGSVVRPILA